MDWEAIAERADATGLRAMKPKGRRVSEALRLDLAAAKEAAAIALDRLGGGEADIRLSGETGKRIDVEVQR